MDDDRFVALSPGQKDCLRLYSRQYQIKEISNELGIAVSTVNQRLERARKHLGVGTSLEAARLLAEHERRSDIWIPPTGSENTLPETQRLAPDSGDTFVEEPEAVGLADAGSTLIRGDGGKPFAHSSIRWPFPTAGRQADDMSPALRLAWTLPCAAVALGLLLLVIVLTVGAQDVLGQLQNSLARLF